ncbi:hypothetical protein D3C85_1054410 [compost metagenome]
MAFIVGIEQRPRRGKRLINDFPIRVDASQQRFGGAGIRVDDELEIRARIGARRHINGVDGVRFGPRLLRDRPVDAADVGQLVLRQPGQRQ